MPRKSLTEEIINNIIADYNSGMFGKDISKKYHIDFVSLKKKLVSDGRLIPREKELNYNDLLTIIDRYKNGEYLKDLANEYDIGITKLMSTLKNNNLYIKKYEFVSDKELEIYIKDYNNGDGITPNEMSIKYNRSDSTIINALRKAGVYIEQTSRWTDDEIAVLEKYYSIEPIDEIIKKLPRHPNKQKIFSKASSLGIKGYSPNGWTDEEVKILSEKYGKVSNDMLYEEFNHRHTIGAIRCKAQKMNLNSNPFWTDEEKMIIQENYSFMDFNELKKLLPTKSEDAIRGMAKKLSQKSKYYLDEKYSDEQKEFIANNCSFMTDVEIAKILGKTPAGIMAQRNKMGFYKINKDYTKYESINKFFRGHIQQWKNDSMKSCDYKCILTGDKDFAIHHIYGFNFIVKEVYDILEEENIIISTNIEDYSKEQLDYMLDIFSKIHSQYPLGVCVRKDIHNLFHNIYGSGGNTQEQWDRFCNDFKNGLYLEQIA